MPVTPASVVSHSAGFYSTPLGPEIVFLNPRKDTYVGLDEIGRRIWDLLATPSTVHELSARLELEFQGSTGEITADLTAFLNELMESGLIDVADIPGALLPLKCTDTPASP
jgi:hypothetical protein